jgi:hypothetical protein
VARCRWSGVVGLVVVLYTVIAAHSPEHAYLLSLTETNQAALDTDRRPPGRYARMRR